MIHNLQYRLKNSIRILKTSTILRIHTLIDNIYSFTFNPNINSCDLIRNTINDILHNYTLDNIEQIELIKIDNILIEYEKSPSDIM